MSNLITPKQIQSALDAEPMEVLMAVHKRIVDTEKLMREYRILAQEHQLEIEIAREKFEALNKRIEKLEKKLEKQNDGKNEGQLELFDLD